MAPLICGAKRWRSTLKCISLTNVTCPKVQSERLFSIARRPSRCREYRHHLDVPAAALAADEPPMLRHINEDHVVPELQLLERFYRLMIAAEAMHSEGRLAAGASMGNGLCGLATRHAGRIATG